MEWNLILSDSTVLLVINGIETGTVKGLKAVKDSLMLLKVRGEGRCWKLNFSDCSELEKGTRTAYVEKWSGLVSCFSESTSDSSMSDESFTEISEQSEAEHSEICEVPNLVSRNHNGACDLELKDNYIGVFDVLVFNLIPPSPLRQSRVLDMRHVTELATSFGAQGLTQIVVLVGMVSSLCVVDELKTKGSASVETLGGNHSREALQNLIARGLISASTTVKIHLYRPLSHCAALLLGWQHNSIVQERQKPLTCMDKVRLMRRLKPALMEKTAVKTWKSTLATIFNVSSCRRFNSSYHTHLKIAEWNEGLYARLETAASKVNISEPVLRGVLKVKDETRMLDSLQCLIDDGLTAYKKKIHAYCKDRVVEVVDDLDVMEVLEIATNSDKKDEGLQEKYSVLLSKLKAVEEERTRLQLDNDRLVEEIRILKEKEVSQVKKRKMEQENEDAEFRIDEHVEAFWQYEDGTSKWLPAIVKKKYKCGDMSVLYEDGIARVRESWIKKFGKP